MPPRQPSNLAAPGPRLRATLVVLVSGAMFAYIFRHVLLAPRFFYYRDTAYFFHSLFKYVHQQWTAGKIPLWNPYSNGGLPLLAQGTPAALYPGQLVFCLPFKFEVNLNLYILGHFGLALIGTYLLARRLRTSPVAAGVAATSYVFSGAVLFQYCNLPFLCSSAWMPLAFLATLHVFRRKSWGWALALAAVATMMVLAGDPQGAYHALVLAGLLALLYWITAMRRRPEADKMSAAPGAPLEELIEWCRVRWRRRTLALLLVAGGTSLLLSAVQVLPTAELSGRSTRAASQTPAGLYQVPGYLLRGQRLPPRVDTQQPPNWYDGLIGNPVPGEQNHIFRYLFSLAPLRLLEFVWPNFAGRMRVELRWLRMVRGEDLNLWFPTCYLGLAPLALAAAMFAPLARRPVIAWLSWIAIIGTLGSLGCYGPVWLYRWLIHGRAEHMPDAVGGEVGGVYWLLTTLLPAYDNFRYPSKLMPLAVLAISLLAALGMRRLTRNGQWLARSRYLLLGVAGASFLALAAVLLRSDIVLDRLSDRNRVQFSDVLQPAAIVQELRFTFLHALALSLGLLALLHYGRASSEAPHWRRMLSTWSPTAMLAITALELTAAHRWMIITRRCSTIVSRRSCASFLKPRPRCRPRSALAGRLCVCIKHQG